MTRKILNTIAKAAFIILLAACTASAAPAAKGSASKSPAGDKKTKGELQHRFEQMIILELSNKLSLPQDKEDKLFDILRTHFRQRRELSEKQFTTMKALREAYDAPSTSDTKLKQLLDQLMTTQEGQMKLETELHKKIRSMLTTKEQAKFVLEWPVVLDSIRGMLKEKRGKGMHMKGWGKSQSPER